MSEVDGRAWGCGQTGKGEEGKIRSLVVFVEARAFTLVQGKKFRVHFLGFTNQSKFAQTRSRKMLPHIICDFEPMATITTAR
jgi:hypothetical protein